MLISLAPVAAASLSACLQFFLVLFCGVFFFLFFSIHQLRLPRLHVFQVPAASLSIKRSQSLNGNRVAGGGGIKTGETQWRRRECEVKIADEDLRCSVEVLDEPEIDQKINKYRDDRLHRCQSPPRFPGREGTQFEPPPFYFLLLFFPPTPTGGSWSPALFRGATIITPLPED